MSRLTSQSHDNGFRAKNPDGMMEAYSDDGDREADRRGGGAVTILMTVQLIITQAKITMILC